MVFDHRPNLAEIHLTGIARFQFTHHLAHIPDRSRAETSDVMAVINRFASPRHRHPAVSAGNPRSRSISAQSLSRPAPAAHPLHRRARFP